MSVAWVLAREIVPAWKAVTADGYIADSGNASHVLKVVGITTHGAVAFVGADVASMGEYVESPLWNWTIGQLVYLNGKNLSHTAPVVGFSQIIGIATHVNGLIVLLYQPIVLPVPEPAEILDVGEGPILDAGGGEIKGV